MKYFTDKANYYMTRRVSENVEQEIINLMIGMIQENNRDGIKSDYFKVFKFDNIIEKGQRYLVVTETQERPRMKIQKKYVYADDEEILLNSKHSTTIWCISDGIWKETETITFLFPDEY